MLSQRSAATQHMQCMSREAVGFHSLLCPGPQAAYLTFKMVLPLTRLWHAEPALLVDAHASGALPAYFAGVHKFRELSAGVASSTASLGALLHSPAMH